MINTIGFWLRRMGDVKRLGVVGAFLAILQTPAQANDHQCLTEALYFEARNQGQRGMLAVGIIIQNRVRDPKFPSDVCSVVRQGRYWRGNPVKHLCQFSYWCDGKHERPMEMQPWTMAREMAGLLLDTRIEIKALRGMTHYHTIWVRPSWSRKYKSRHRIGEHIFYAKN